LIRQTDWPFSGTCSRRPALCGTLGIAILFAFSGAGCSRWAVFPRPESPPGSETESEASRKPVSTAGQTAAAQTPERPASESGETTSVGPWSGAPAPARAKIEGLHAWQEGRAESPPAGLADLAKDPNPLVRAAAVEAAAARRTTDSEKLAGSALADQNLQVRLAGVAALGTLGSENAVATLLPLLDDPGEVIRAATVRALARQGDEAVLVRASKDRSWLVRLAAAEALASHPDDAGTQLARQLLDDRSAAVQVAVVRCVGQWPVSRARPILLAAVGSNARSTREAAVGQLAAACPAAADFPIDGSPAERARAHARLQEWYSGQAAADSGTADTAKESREKPPESRPTAEQVGDVRRAIGEMQAPGASTKTREESLRRLAAYGPSLVGILEALTAETPSPLPEEVYQDVLPNCAPEFAAMAQLRVTEVSARRRAAEELASRRHGKPLGPLARSRLAAVVEREPDSLVWRSVLGAIADDTSEPSIRLACTAASHPSPEVRRLACEYLLHHPEVKREPVLLAALQDPHREVVLAAVRALGARSMVDDRQPLRSLLGSPDESMRVEAAAALARLGDPSGPAALGRLACSRDPTIRRQAAVAMGQVPSPEYRATLIRLLDDRYSIRLAALESLSKVAGKDPATDPETGTIEERIARWKSGGIPDPRGAGR